MLFAKHLFLNAKYASPAICSWDLYLIFVFSTGPCSPMREIAMTFALQKKGVSWHCCQVFMLLMPCNYQMCKGISLSAYSRRAGVNTQSVACHAPDPSICKGRKPTVTQLTTVTIWCFPNFIYQMEDWRSWWRSWTAEKSCMHFAECRIQTLVCLNMFS